MLTTVGVVVATHDLSLGVRAGVLLAGIFFAAKVQRMFEVRRDVRPDGMRATYFVTGQIFFASVDRFTRSFQVDEAAPAILIDVSAAPFSDISGVERESGGVGRGGDVRVVLGGRRCIKKKDSIDK